jgi:hypothetical protein
MVVECVDCRKRDDETLSDAVYLQRRRQLLSSYLLSLQKGANWVRGMILEDISSLRDLGAHRQVADLEVVLDCFQSRYPEVEGSQHLCESRGGVFAPEAA